MKFRVTSHSGAHWVEDENGDTIATFGHREDAEHCRTVCALIWDKGVAHGRLGEQLTQSVGALPPFLPGMNETGPAMETPDRMALCESRRAGLLAAVPGLDGGQ